MTTFMTISTAGKYHEGLYRSPGIALHPDHMMPEAEEALRHLWVLGEMAERVLKVSNTRRYMASRNIVASHWSL